MKKFIVILALAALACSCEIPFSIKDISEPRFMIQCMPVPGEEAFLLNVAYANPAYGEKHVGLYPFKSMDIKVEVDGKTLLEIAIEKMKQLHAQRIVVNVHHFADLMTKYIQERDWGVEVLISDESQQLLDTGGGLKHAEPLFSGEHNWPLWPSAIVTLPVSFSSTAKTD